jgi:hypothetical protein
MDIQTTAMKVTMVAVHVAGIVGGIVGGLWFFDHFS